MSNVCQRRRIRRGQIGGFVDRPCLQRLQCARFVDVEDRVELVRQVRAEIILTRSLSGR
jgi:hypothetical protein